jgi:hypothetical protein
LLRLDREVYPTITKDPATLLGELDNGAFRFEEEKVLGVENRQGWVGFLGAVCNLAANGSDKDLRRKPKSASFSRP